VTIYGIGHGGEDRIKEGVNADERLNEALIYPCFYSPEARRWSLRVAVVFGVLFLILLDVVFLFFVVFF
jgi:hypothetical protein